MTQDYESLMLKALALAEKGRFHACPNPCVGAILLKDGEIIGRGWHHHAGAPHAEIECLQNCRENGHDPKGATMVVTLEPCAHFGKTPPCADALIAAGVAKLVYGAADPNPQAQGGLEKLRQAGIEVIGPVCEEKCRDMIADFIVWQTTQRPYIILKLASTLDGRIATRTGHSRWISASGSRELVHEMRAGIAACNGAILIGGGTFRADNPSLIARAGCNASATQPLACILTSRLPKKDADFHLLKDSPERTVFFASPAVAASTAAEALRQLGCRIFAIGQNAGGGPDFSLMFRIIREELGCLYTLCEGGGHMALSLLEERYVDEFHLHMAPLILGDNDAIPLFSGRSPLELDEALALRFCGVSLWAGDAHLLLRPAKSDS